MKLFELRRAGRDPKLPLQMQLPDGRLTLLQWLRVLPNRRYVALAEWQGRRVLAKLLVGRKARRQYLRERAGAACLAEQELPAPALLAHGYQVSDGGWLLFDFLEGAESLGCRWRTVAGQPPLSADQRAILGAALEAIGAMHARGLWQEDLHLDNLLYHNLKLNWVDCGTIRAAQPGRSLAVRQALVSLAVFFAQFPATFDRFVSCLLESYQRGGGCQGLSADELLRQIASTRRRRCRRFLAKTGRECTEFSVRRGPMELRAVRRDELAALQPLLADPDRFIAQGKILKAGGSATVACVCVDGRMLVIKRYNIKGVGHWLRRFWRPSRAWQAWRMGHLLGFLGVATAQPLAVLERRYCWLRERAYLVTEHLDGENILCRFGSPVNGTLPPEELVALDDLFATLGRERISHGDLKGTNLIWHDSRWALIDLDALRQHRTARSFALAFARDRARFLRNWPVDSVLFQRLDRRLPEAPGVSSVQRG